MTLSGENAAATIGGPTNATTCPVGTSAEDDVRRRSLRARVIQTSTLAEDSRGRQEVDEVGVLEVAECAYRLHEEVGDQAGAHDGQQPAPESRAHACQVTSTPPLMWSSWALIPVLVSRKSTAPATSSMVTNRPIGVRGTWG